MTTVEDILREKKSTRIPTVRMDETIATAAAMMKRDDVGALVVKDVCRTEGDVVVGLFSERDVATALATHGASAPAMPVSAFLNRPLVRCTVDHGVEAVLRLMDEHQVELLPILEGHTLIGAISIGEIIRHLTHAPIPHASSAIRCNGSRHRATPGGRTRWGSTGSNLDFEESRA